MGFASHVGRVRRVNEDSLLTTRNLLVIADGMGGHARGDEASSLAIQGFDELDSNTLTPEVVQEAIAAANDTIVAAAIASAEKSGMGTTLTGLAIVDLGGSPHWLVFNVGDSRVYRLFGGSLVQITTDHSEVAELVAAGRITAEQAKRHPARNVITRSLGSTPAPVVDLWVFPPEEGECFVLCSDGLTNELSDENIARITTAANSPRDAAALLVDAAVEAGGHDNVTVIVVGLVSESVEDASDVDTTPRRALDTSAEVGHVG